MATAVSQFRNRILADVSGCPIPRIDQAIVDAVRDFCEDAHILRKAFEVELTSPFVDTTDSDSVTIDLAGNLTPNTLPLVFPFSFSGYELIFPLMFQIDGVPVNIFRFNMDTDNTYIESMLIQNSKFYNFPSKTLLKIFPFTDATTCKLFMNWAIKPTDGSTSVDDLFYDDWRNAVMYLALSNLQKIPKKPWTDYEAAAFNRSLYRHEMARAKAKAATGFTPTDQFVTGGYF